MSALPAIFWRPIPDVIALLPKGAQHAATVAMKCVLRLKSRGELDETATDLELAAESERMAREIAQAASKDLDGERGWSPSFIQKGLHALHVLLGELGTPLIDRKSGIGMHGRRQIEVLPLSGSEAPASGSSCTSSVDRVDKTTTDTRSSSSPSSREAEKTGEVPAPELVNRACALIPKATRGRVVDAVSTYGSEWVSRALDVVERRNSQCAAAGKKPVRSWGYVLGILGNWKREGGPPPAESSAPAVAPPAKAAADHRAAARAEELAGTARLDVLRAAWEGLEESVRQSIRDAVRDEHPHAVRIAAVFDRLCLEEFDRRRGDEAVEPHPRE